MLNKELFKSFFWRFSQIFSKQGSSFLVFVISSKYLSSYEFGLYNYLLASVFFLAMLCDFGMSTAVAKYTTEYETIDKEKTNQIVPTMIIVIFCLFILIFLFLLEFGYLFFKDNYKYVLYLSPLIFLIPATAVYDGFYRGLKKFRRLSLMSLLVAVINIPTAFYLTSKFGLEGGFASQILLYFVLLLFMFFDSKNFIITFNSIIFKKIGYYGMVFGFASVGYFLFSRVDILVLGKLGYINEISYYELLNKILQITLLPFIIFGQVIAPNFSRLSALNKKKEIFTEFKKIWIASVVSCVLYFLLMISLLPTIIKIFYPEYYTVTLFNIILPCILLFSLQVYTVYINSGVIVAIGEASLMTILNFFMVLINFSLMYLFYDYFSYVGIIYSTVLSLLVGILFLHTSFYYKIKKYES